MAVNNFVVELWLHLSIIQARLILHSVCTNLGFLLLAVINDYRLTFTVYRLPFNVNRYWLLILNTTLYTLHSTL